VNPPDCGRASCLPDSCIMLSEPRSSMPCQAAGCQPDIESYALNLLTMLTERADILFPGCRKSQAPTAQRGPVALDVGFKPNESTFAGVGGLIA